MLRFQLSIPTSDLEDFAACCETAGWKIHDSGERVTTDDGIDGEAVILVETPVPTRPSSIVIQVTP